MWCSACTLHLCVHVFQLDTFCFNQSIYIVDEDAEFAVMTLIFSSIVKEEIMVRFRYIDLTATGELHVITYVLCLQIWYYILWYDVKDTISVL